MIFTTLARITNPVVGNLGTVTSGTDAGDKFASLIATTLRFLVILGGIIMLLFLIKGAFGWITSEGKPDKLEAARNQIIQAISGMIILAAVVAISSFLGIALGFNFLEINIPTINEI